MAKAKLDTDIFCESVAINGSLGREEASILIGGVLDLQKALAWALDNLTTPTYDSDPEYGDRCLAARRLVEEEEKPEPSSNEFVVDFYWRERRFVRAKDGQAALNAATDCPTDVEDLEILYTEWRQATPEEGANIPTWLFDEEDE